MCVEQNGSVYISINGGANWTAQTMLPSPGNWTAVSASGDGSLLVAVESGGNIYTYQNGTWTKQPGAGVDNWSTVTTSYNGSTIVAGTEGSMHVGGGLR